MALYTCDNSDCFLHRQERSFDYGFNCPRGAAIGAPCAAREVTITAPPTSHGLSQQSATAGSWGLDRSRGGRTDDLYGPTTEAGSVVPPSAPEPQRSIVPVLIPWTLVALLAVGGGAYVFRAPIAAAIGVSAGGSEAANARAATEARLKEALFTAGYAHEMSNKLLSIRRQVEAIRQRGEATAPEIAAQLSEIEAKLAKDENERRAAFQAYLKTVELLGKQPAAEIDGAFTTTGTAIDEAKLTRLKSLLPVIKRQIVDARSGKIDHDKWISQIEVAPI